MINEIYVNGVLVTDPSPRKQFKEHGYDIRCTSCSELINRKWFTKTILEQPYICKACVLTYHNPMHTEGGMRNYLKWTRDPDRRRKHSERMSGETNPFYGKTHSDGAIETIRHANIEYQRSLSDEDRFRVSDRMSRIQQNMISEDPEGYSEMKRLAARESHKSQFKNYAPNSIESIVEQWLLDHNIPYKFSLILGFKQFDFGIKNPRVLIEVDGDYWHGNPAIYNMDGSGGKRKLNNIQLGKIKEDVKKNIWALEHEYKLIRIWESDIRSGDYKTILERELLSYYETNGNSINKEKTL